VFDFHEVCHPYDRHVACLNNNNLFNVQSEKSTLVVRWLSCCYYTALSYDVIRGVFVLFTFCYNESSWSDLV